MKKYICLIIFCFLYSICLAETISLKSGNKVEGKIIEHTDTYIKVDEGVGIPITYFLDGIDEIDGEKISPPSKETITESDSEISSTISKELTRPIEVQPTQIIGTTKEETKKDSVKLAKLIRIPTLILWFLLYIYFSFCLQLIAKKTNQEAFWLAWIPFANFFLMCKIAGVSYSWLLLLFSVIIPFVGLICVAALWAFIWYKIALALDKPGWIGGFAFIPLVGFIVMGYLAFSDTSIAFLCTNIYLLINFTQGALILKDGFLQMYREYNLSLPFITSIFVQRYYIVSIVLALILIINKWIKIKSISLIINIMVFIIILLVYIIYMLALLAPLFLLTK